MTADAVTTHAASRGAPFASSITALPSRFRPPTPTGDTFLPNNFDRPRRMRVNLATCGPEAGNWVIAIDNGACRVLAGSVSAPDARLYTDSDIGHAIISGSLSLDQALESRLLDYDGDPAHLAQLRACFRFGEGL